MDYPDQLLPKPSYRIIQFRDDLTSIYLVRHTDTHDIQDEYGRLKSECVVFRTDHLKNYSISLLGEFCPEDITFDCFKGKNWHELWQETSLVSTPIELEDFAVKNERGFFYLKFTTFHEQQVNNAEFTCCVLHQPTNCNFWHCCLRWFVGREDVIDWKEKKRRAILATARSFIIENAIFKTPPYHSIDPKLYIDTSRDTVL